MNRVGILAIVLLSLGITVAPVAGAEIMGTISSTMTITDDSELVGDVMCTVTGAPCISFGAPGLTLKLNGFAMTGKADALTPCMSAGPGEAGIAVNNQSHERILGPGLVQQFRQFGIRLISSTRVTVEGVTLADNCFSGIFASGGSHHSLKANISVRNGHPSNPCGGI